MKVPINADREAKQLTLTLTDLDWEAGQQRDFYQGEQQLQHVVTAIGQELTRPLLASKVTSVPTLCQAGQVWYRKAESAGHSLTLYGPITGPRPTYQTSAGGETCCPLEADCQLAFGAATPLLAEIVSFKLSALTAREVQRDLAKTHGLALSASFLQQTAQRVGQVAVDKATAWELSGPEPAPDVAIVATGLDGTTLPLVGEAYKGAMCGTLALSDDTGERLTTAYLGTLPEAGKATFTELFTTRVSAGPATPRRCTSCWPTARPGTGNCWRRSTPQRSGCWTSIMQCSTWQQRPTCSLAQLPARRKRRGMSGGARRCGRTATGWPR
jgi:hypothetical protein